MLATVATMKLPRIDVLLDQSSLKLCSSLRITHGVLAWQGCYATALHSPMSGFALFRSGMVLMACRYNRH